MFINGLATGVHSGADNIVATATQYPAGGLEWAGGILKPEWFEEEKKN